MPEEGELRSIPAEHRASKKPELPEFNVKNVVILFLAVGIAVLALYVFKPEWFKGVIKSNPKATPKAEVKASEYSAVFLTNNQVYFGKIEDRSADFIKLKDVYYLRVNQGAQTGQPATGAAAPDSGLSLVKLGGELHGPSDEIKFNRDQVLLIEELKTDSRVVKAIEEYKRKNP